MLLKVPADFRRQKKLLGYFFSPALPVGMSGLSKLSLPLQRVSRSERSVSITYRSSFVK